MTVTYNWEQTQTYLEDVVGHPLLARAIGGLVKVHACDLIDIRLELVLRLCRLWGV